MHKIIKFCDNYKYIANDIKAGTKLFCKEIDSREDKIRTLRRLSSKF